MREASTSERVGILCQCKGLCSTKRCRCYKESREYSVHYYRDDHDCGNLSGLPIRTEATLVERRKRKRARANTTGIVDNEYIFICGWPRPFMNGLVQSEMHLFMGGLGHS